jgi:rhamnosyl/mannosyltransferase
LAIPQDFWEFALSIRIVQILIAWERETLDILHLYKDYYPVLGGIENYIKVLAEAHVAAGHRVTVLVCDPGRRTRTETHHRVRVIKAGRLATVASMPLSLAQPAILARLCPDIIHIHSPYPLGEVANWLIGRAKATVITYHSDVIRQKQLLRFYGPLLRRILGAADCIIASSPRYIETSPWLRFVRDKCVVSPLGVDVTRFTPPDRPYTGPFTLLFVGRLRYYKGLDTLLHALTHVPEAQLIVVGEGPMGKSWKELSQALELAGRVTFAGEVDDADLPGYYQRASLFVLPANARAEAFGTVLLEAMASGLPCITTELGTGTSWIVEDGVTGFVVAPMDPPALAEAIRRMQDASLRHRMGQAAYEWLRKSFTQTQMIARVMEVYETVLHGRQLR